MVLYFPLLLNDFEIFIESDLRNPIFQTPFCFIHSVTINCVRHNFPNMGRVSIIGRKFVPIIDHPDTLEKSKKVAQFLHRNYKVTILDYNRMND